MSLPALASSCALLLLAPASDPPARGPAPVAADPRGMSDGAGLPWSAGVRPQRVPAPLPAAYCDVVVEGQGTFDLETEYLPRVVRCENGGANLEALKAQAIAARSVAYYNMATEGSICDSQGCQVFGCAGDPGPEHVAAVQATSGQYLMYSGTLTYGFYVAGDSTLTAPACVGDDADASTERYVTYNAGKTGTAVEQTTLGFVFDPGDGGYGQNRGCMSQWGARCLENNNGATYLDILRFYYGDDIMIVQAEGPCVEGLARPPAGALEPVADCGPIRGWAADPDRQGEPLELSVVFDGELGAPGATELRVLADAYRAELCVPQGSCNHGFELPVPMALRDGAAHEVRLVAFDDDGAQVMIAGSPASFTCAQPAVPAGERRALSGAAAERWRLDPFLLAIPVDEPTLSMLPEGPAFPVAPALRADEGTGVLWLEDQGLRRGVTLTAFAGWGLRTADATPWTAAERDALALGSPWRDAPSLVQGPDAALYVIDDPQPVGGGTSGGVGSTTGDATTAGSETEGGGTSGAASATSAGGSGDTSAGGSAGGLPPSQAGDDGDGCGCTTRSSDGRRDGLLALAGVVMLLGARSRRRTPLTPCG